MDGSPVGALQFFVILWHFSHGIPLFKAPFIGHFCHFLASFVMKFPCSRVRSLAILTILWQLRPEIPVLKAPFIGHSALFVEFTSATSEL